MKAVELTLGGRKVRQILKSTVRHDLHMMEAIRKSGLNGIVKHVDESPQAFAKRLLDTLISTGSFVPVLASCFIDAEKEDLSWTPESSEQLAQFFSELSEPEDKQVVFGYAVQLVMDFFKSGVVSLEVSLSSLKSQVETGRNGPEQNGEIVATGEQ